MSWAVPLGPWSLTAAGHAEPLLPCELQGGALNGACLRGPCRASQPWPGVRSRRTDPCHLREGASAQLVGAE